MQNSSTTTEQPPAKKTADMNAYMREYMKAYRVANLEKCREQDRAKYHRRKPVDDDGKRKKAEQTLLSILGKYPELLEDL